MYAISDAWHPVATLYFVLIVMLVPFFSVNLVLAVSTPRSRAAAHSSLGARKGRAALQGSPA